MGNRTTLTENSVSTSYGYDTNSNRLNLINTSTVTTDANGNLTHNGLYTIEHTTDNRVKRILQGANEKARYVYNGLGQRVQKTTATQTINYLYGLNGELLAEFNASHELLKHYIYFNGQPMAFVDKDVNNDFIPDATVAVVRYIHNDHLGTPKIVTDNNGVIVWSAKARPFGGASVNADVDGDGVNVVFNLRQPGQYFDVESGFYYNYFRYYDPQIGRYITSDPIGLDDGPNTYAFVGNNPLNYFDPDGLSRRRNNAQTPGQSLINLQVNSLIRQIRQIDPAFSYQTLRPTGPRGRFNNRDINSLQQSLDNAKNAGFCGPGAANAPAMPTGTSQLGHIFRSASGHVNPSTQSSQTRFSNLFRSVAGNSANRNDTGAGVRPHAVQFGGVSGFTSTFRNGTVWVQVGGSGVIQNAGVNRN